jgi:hypothetical protein
MQLYSKTINGVLPSSSLATSRGCTEWSLLTKGLMKICTKFWKNRSKELITSWYVSTVLKQSHYRPAQALRVPGGWGSQFPRQSAHEGRKVGSHMHRPLLPPQEVFLVLISVRGWVDPRAMVWPEGLCQRKIPMIPSGIKPATVQLVA